MDWPRLIASGCGVGFAPRAPGTFGSVAGLVLGAILLNFGHGPLIVGILLISAAGVWAVERVGGADDAGWIVIDEVAGQMIAMVALARVSLLGLVLVFAFFRLFDITKLGPIGYFDRRHDAWGVMGDDWVAGLFAMICVAILFLLLPVQRP